VEKNYKNDLAKSLVDEEVGWIEYSVALSDYEACHLLQVFSSYFPSE
jgi:hypothetical protein